MKKLLSLCLFTLFILISCSKKDDDNNTDPQPKPTIKVTYNIGCTDCQTIYYKDSLENQSTENHQNSSWTYTFYARRGQKALLFAYNTSGSSQGVTATIKVNDVVTQTQTNYCPISGYSFVVDSIE
jgi:hypothetical protein